MSDHVSDLRWDRLLAGELPEDQATEARTHAAGCERCGSRLTELTAGRDAFTVNRTPFDLARDRDISALPQVIAFAPRRKRGVWIGVAGAIVAAAAIVFLVVRPRGPDAGERSKGGGPDLVLVVTRDARQIPVSSRDQVFPNDVLQAGYSSTRDGFGAVLARDGAEGVFAYVPSSGDQMLALPAGDNRTFPQSTTLDDVVGQERVVVVWCEAPRPIAPLLAELRTSGEVTAPDGCVVRRIDLAKQAHP